MTSDDALHEKTCPKLGGAVPGPWDCFLQLRGLKTLHPRMERHQQSARTRGRLNARSDVGIVHYPAFREW